MTAQDLNQLMTAQDLKKALREFYGDNYAVLRGLICHAAHCKVAQADQYLDAVREALAIFRPSREPRVTRRDLKRFANYMRKAERLLLACPDIPYQLIYDPPDQFLPPDLLGVLKHYAESAERAQGGAHMPTKRRPPKTRQFRLLQFLVIKYRKIFRVPPAYSRDSKFHEAAGYLLMQAGHEFSSEQPDIEKMLHEAVLSVMQQKSPQ